MPGTHYDGRRKLPRLDFERRNFPVRELMREKLRALREADEDRRA